MNSSVLSRIVNENQLPLLRLCERDYMAGKVQTSLVHPPMDDTYFLINITIITTNVMPFTWLVKHIGSMKCFI